MADSNNDRLEITDETMDAFLKSMVQNNRSPNSIETYRRILTKFYEYLPEEKTVSANTLSQWQKYLLEQGYAARTINAHISILNNFMHFIGKREWQHTVPLAQKENIQPELTRTEYLRLLQTAKVMEKERTYLIIKTLCCIGIRVQELGQITVEAVENGRASVMFYVNNKRLISIPKILRTELLEYAKRENIKSGPIFITRNGTLLNRTNIWNSIQDVCREAHVPEEKANPRCLWKLHQSTYENIQFNISVLIEQAYEQMLDNEELTIGWNA